MQSTAESLYDAQREEKHEKIESNERSRVPNRAGQGQRDGVEACMNMHESVHNITPPYVNGGEKERERPPIYPLLPFSPLSQPDEPAFTFIYINVHLSHVDASWTRHPSYPFRIYILFFFITLEKENPRSFFDRPVWIPRLAIVAFVYSRRITDLEGG